MGLDGMGLDGMDNAVWDGRDRAGMRVGIGGVASRGPTQKSTRGREWSGVEWSWRG